MNIWLRLIVFITIKFFYRVLKPNNLITNKTVVLIDFDYMISDEEQNFEFAEWKLLSLSFDIYLLGMMIYFIILEKEPMINVDEQLNICKSKEHYIARL